MRSFMERYPYIASLFAEYRMCRQVQLFSLETSKGTGKSAKTVTKVTSYPTGYAQLPWPGGMSDQPHRTMQFFEIFLSAERAAASEQLSS